MHMTRLRLLGFKSFLEPTELCVEPGLTGVVGPNGCGKSNLLEALRWAMGETSHKSMRAAAMDDVIFSGTTTRPARNMAEVTITIDNARRTAPAEFNGADTIEITRRIEREAGSAYRINGREARARDVKILFEDAATGARSPALVRQGQIGEIVNAKPEQRRRVLEDAAGIAGLHSRRHEAELRLRAAEGNLARLADILGQLASQVESLKRQARHARRYKEISGEIRRAEAMLAHLQWTAAKAQVDEEERNLAESLARLGTAAEAESRALRAEAELAETLPPLREAEATRAAVVARLRIEQASFEREAERTASRTRELEARTGQLDADLARERALIAEAAEVIERLVAQLTELAVADDGAEASAAGLARELEAAEATLQSEETALHAVTTRAFEARARRKSLENGHAERREAAAKLVRQLDALATQAREIAGRAPDATRLAQAQDAGHRFAADIIRIEQDTVTADEKVQRAAAEAREAQEAAQQAALRAGQLRAEVSALVKLFKPFAEDRAPPALDSIRVAAGFELALGAALGDDLDAALEPTSPVHWRRNEPAEPDPALPDGASPLSAVVEAPIALARRLRQIGIVDRADGKRLQSVLQPGQRLVSREGDLWRWDGYTAAAEAPTPAALRLSERNRLEELERLEAEARRHAEEADAVAREAAERHRAAEEHLRSLRQGWRDTQNQLAKIRETLTVIERAARETEARLAAIADARLRAEDDLVVAHERVAEIEAALEIIGEGTEFDAELAEAQARANACREAVGALRARIAAEERERQMRAEQLKSVKVEHDRWAARTNGANTQVATLEERLALTRKELAELAELPAEIEKQRAKLLDGLAQAERERSSAGDALAAAERALKEASATLKAAQSAVATEREDRARTEARLEAARGRRSEESRRIREVLGVAPEGCLALAGLDAGSALPLLADVDRTLTRLKADRERLGGVNLQADEELTALTAQYDTLEKERADVEEAIAKLRGGIAQLNREGKKRLDEAFETVNGHFQRLFTTLFGGGEARLEMIEGEDPLEGGLEIIARPPGKKPVTLSLLSGGEQSLTALSLIFAVFLTNPSPICVLDEVDAPLDDANVDRFCTLMERMASETETRFLVITHHPMTMARMHRLFGVTMAEKGVSQLVSVDLATAERFASHAEAEGRSGSAAA
jgi:chromosome segregation protein